MENIKNSKVFKHGISGYNYHKCRCDICVTAIRKWSHEWQKDYRLKNDDKIKKYSKEYYATNKEHLCEKNRIRHAKAVRENLNYRREDHWKSTGKNITVGEFTKLMEEQDNKCAICGKDLAWRDKNTHVDHDHNSGLIRGILCNSCNRGIGAFQDSYELLDSAAAYLLRFKDPIKIAM